MTNKDPIIPHTISPSLNTSLNIRNKKLTGYGNPYPGLRAYREDEKGKFFGRDKDTGILIDKALTNRLTLLFAASGVGKSSLLQAAVIPQLKSKTGENLSVVYHADWISNPVKSVSNSVLKALQSAQILPEEIDDQAQGDTLPDLLTFCTVFARPPLVLILDQFEEFFRYQRHQPSFQQFLDQLTTIITDKSLSVSLLISMREDFALELNAFKPKLPTILFENFYRLEKLEKEAVHEAITAPVRRLGYRYEPILLDLLLDDLLNRELTNNLSLPLSDSRRTVESPYLQIVCSKLWELNKDNSDKILRLSTYNGIGKSKGIMLNHLNSVLFELSASEKEIASKAFNNLVSHHGVKMAYTANALSKIILVDQDNLIKVLNKLEKVSVLRKQKRGEETWYELYHDIFSEGIIEWNTAWKEKKWINRLAYIGTLGAIGITGLYLSFNYYNNFNSYYYKINDDPASRIELWRGQPSGLDIFNVGGYILETDFKASEIESDRKSPTINVQKYDDLYFDLIDKMSAKNRKISYYSIGEFKKSALIDARINHQPRVEINNNSGAAKKHTNIIFRHEKDKSCPINDVDQKVNLVKQVLLSGNFSTENLKGKQRRKLNYYLRRAAEFNVTDTLPVVRKHAGSYLATIQEEAIRTLGLLGDESSIKLIEIKLKDRFPKVRQAAAVALGRLNSNDSMPYILKGLQEVKDLPDRVAAFLEAIKQLEERKHLKEVMYLTEKHNTVIKKSLLAIFESIGSPEDSHLLRQWLKREKYNHIKTRIEKTINVIELKEIKLPATPPPFHREKNLDSKVNKYLTNYYRNPDDRYGTNHRRVSKNRLIEAVANIEKKSDLYRKEYLREYVIPLSILKQNESIPRLHDVSIDTYRPNYIDLLKMASNRPNLAPLFSCGFRARDHSGGFSGQVQSLKYIGSSGLITALGFLEEKTTHKDKRVRRNAITSMIMLLKDSNASTIEKKLITKIITTIDIAELRAALNEYNAAEALPYNEPRSISRPGVENKDLTIQELKDKLEQMNQAFEEFREKRDSESTSSSKAISELNNITSFIYEYAYGIAHGDEEEGIKLLEHNLYKVREAAARGLANSSFLGAPLLKKLEKVWLETNDPFEKQGYYHAIDIALLAIEGTGYTNELADLKAYEQTLTNKRSAIYLKPRVEWTRIQLQWRVDANKKLKEDAARQLPKLLKKYCLNEDGTNVTSEECPHYN